tara:strand:- start:11577 stop:12062 length:486 start_codon:yes stop_codon:yes gene_type:complete
MFKFGSRSLKNLEGVHPELVEICDMAIKRTSTDFGISEGVRSLERQKKLKAEGRSQTLNSMHIPQKDGYSWAVDLLGYDSDGKVSWEFPIYFNIMTSIISSAHELGYGIRWGGCWHLSNCVLAYPEMTCEEMMDDYISQRKNANPPRKYFLDLPHIEKSRS